MNGLTDKREQSEVIFSVDIFKQTILNINTDGVEVMLNIWSELYGKTNDLGDRIGKLVDDVKAFWESQVESQKERKKNVIKSIQQAGKDAVKLEKILALKPEVQNLGSDENMPLVTLEEQVWKILNTYQEIRGKRIEEYSQLQKREEELCGILNLKPQIRGEATGTRKGGNLKRNVSYIPTVDKMSDYKNRVSELEKQKEQLEYDFEVYREKIRSLSEQCQVHPTKVEEKYISLEKEKFPVTSKNLRLLKSTVDRYETLRKEMIGEADSVRKEVSSLTKKMLMDVDECEQFLRKNCGFTKNTIDILREKLNQLKEIRKTKLKDLIIGHRKILNEMWEKCRISEEEKNQFKPYQSNHWSEEVLNFHEIEIERLEYFYEQNKRIFQLAEKYDDLWERLLHLEELASNKDRLFNNRGGCLLKEEKERKIIQKKVPAIKSELLALLEKYKEETGKDFMHFGMPLQQKIEQRDEQREISKENEKFMRKVNNEDKLGLGFRAPNSVKKRKCFTPQNSMSYSKVIKTAAYSTPRLSRSASTLMSGPESAWARVNKENELKPNSFLAGKPRTTYFIQKRCDTPRPPRKTAASTPLSSPSYESFKEHIKSGISHKKCTQPEERKVLRPRNNNKPTLRCLSEKKVRKVTTPIARTNFKSATISKIPRATTPSGRETPRNRTGIRRKLPIIF